MQKPRRNTHLVPCSNAQIQINTGSDSIGYVVLSEVDQVRQRVRGDGSRSGSVDTGTRAASGAARDDGGSAVRCGCGVLNATGKEGKRFSTYTLLKTGEYMYQHTRRYTQGREYYQQNLNTHE